MLVITSIRLYTGIFNISNIHIDKFYQVITTIHINTTHNLLVILIVIVQSIVSVLTIMQLKV